MRIAGGGADEGFGFDMVKIIDRLADPIFHEWIYCASEMTLFKATILLGFWIPLVWMPAAYGQEAAASLRGRVLDAATREPIGKALVSLRNLQAERTTNDAGEFAFSGMTAGRVEI